MNSVSPGSAPGENQPADVLRAAADQLRGQPLPRVVQVADQVLRQALAAPRRAVLVQARAPFDFLRVSSIALTAVLRDRVDGSLRGAALGRVGLVVDRSESLEQLTLELIVQYGADILDLADQARGLTHETLAALLGPDASTVPVTVSHVHVSDVTVGDPHLVHPGEE